MKAKYNRYRNLPIDAKLVSLICNVDSSVKFLEIFSVTLILIIAIYQHYHHFCKVWNFRIISDLYIYTMTLFVFIIYFPFFSRQPWNTLALHHSPNSLQLSQLTHTKFCVPACKTSTPIMTTCATVSKKHGGTKELRDSTGACHHTWCTWCPTFVWYS